MKKLLVIGHVWPEPTTTAAGNRMMQLLEAFLNKNYQVTFASTAQKTVYSRDLSKLGIPEVTIQLNDSSFDRFIHREQPSMVLFDRFMVEEQFGWRVAEHCPNAIRILNTEDLHSLRDYRGKCLKDNLQFTIEGYFLQDKTKREIASIYRSDLTLLVSYFEKQLLENELQMHPELLWHLPLMFERIEQEKIKTWPKYSQRKDFVAYGNGKHAPNIDAFKGLKERIWPDIRKQLPAAQLHIYGAYLPKFILEMNNLQEGFLVHGWIEELNEKVLNSRVVLAPIRFGAGIKGKLLKAMEHGTPSISTSVGVEGMTKRRWPGIITDDADAFANAAVTLYQNKKLWKDAQKLGISIINEEYKKEELTTNFFTHLEDIKLGKHRAKNRIGSLLWHQSMTATKYMGKWIEEKNKTKNSAS